MSGEIRIYELEVIRNGEGGPPWGCWLRLSLEERENLSFRCTRARDSGSILTYTITEVSPIYSAELRNALPQDLKEALGFSGPKILKRTP